MALRRHPHVLDLRPRLQLSALYRSLLQESDVPNTKHRGVPFDPDEVRYLVALEQKLRRIEAWPLDSPLAFVIHLAPRTRGKLGEMLLDEIAGGVDLATRPSGSAAYDRRLVCPDGSVVRFETKFSTEDPPRFQQVRDPRLEDGDHKYDHLLCISGRPQGLVYWVMSADEVAAAMDDGSMTVQHAMSDTKWFFPSRTELDYFAPYRHDYEAVRLWLSELCR